MTDLTFPATWNNVALDVTDSTNSEAMRRIAAGDTGPTWITATVQTAGRGRSGRSWSTERGNLAASLLFAPATTPAHLPELALVAGLAVHGAATSLIPEAPPGHITIKWPNDLLIADAKVSGILIESTNQGGTVVAIIGIGLNLASTPNIPGRQLTSLSCQPDFGGSFEQASTILAAQLARYLGIWDHGRGFSAIRTLWLERSVPIGRILRVNSGSGPVEGRFAGLDLDGALLLDLPGGHRQKFTFGDVTLAQDRDKRTSR
ncbi:MAG: biotin--[acetyl-CoA-carboxylase] ligase [Hyphomicrobiaceae bacterium]